MEYPIDEFDPAFGAVIAVGVSKENLDLRVGYRYIKLDMDHVLPEVDTSRSDDELDLSALFIEITYRFHLPAF